MKLLVSTTLLATLILSCGPSQEKIDAFGREKEVFDDQLKKTEIAITKLCDCEAKNSEESCTEMNEQVKFEIDYLATCIEGLVTMSEGGSVPDSEKVIDEAKEKQKAMIKKWETCK